MISFAIGGLDLTNYVSGYQVNKSDITQDNDFTDANTGDKVKDVIGIKTTLKISLSKMNGATAGQVMDALYGDSITVASNGPGSPSGEYSRDGDVNISSGWVGRTGSAGTDGADDGVEWKIDFSLSRTETTGSETGADGL